MSVCISIFSSCNKEWQSSAKAEGPLRVFLHVAGSGISTRTSINSDGVSTSWDNDDAVCLWAKANDGSYTLSQKKFIVYGNAGTSGVFSSILDNPMDEGQYTYWACCPEPVSVSGTSVHFSVPSVQDGRGSCDVMVSVPVSHGPLTSVLDPDSAEGLEVRMKHLTHLLDFYINDKDGLLGGEPVKSIEVGLPRSVTGDITTDLEAGSCTTASDGNASLTLDLEEPLAVSSTSDRHYASAVILPFTADPGDKISLTLYTENKIVTTEPILLAERTFAAGHATPVMVQPASATQIYNAYFTIAANHLGEDIQTIRITGPAGCRFGDGGTNTWVCTAEEAVAQGGRFTLSYTSQEDFMSISGKALSIEFESENAIVSSNAAIPVITGTSCNTDLTVPYLYIEDFSTTTRSSEYNSNNGTGSSSGGSNNSVDLSGRGWPAGWYGARCGIKAGDKIRLTARGEAVNVIVNWTGTYNGRIDSPTMSNIKEQSAGVHLRIEFDFASGWNGSKSNKVNHYIAVGVHNKQGAINSVGALNNLGRAMEIDTVVYEDIEFIPSDSQMDSKTYPQTTRNMACITPQLCKKDSRITWESYLKNNTGDGYYNFWVFIDNIRVSIAK